MNALSSDGTACNLSQKRITSLREGDFQGLNNLLELNLDDNDLSSLPADLFQDLNNLQQVGLYGNDLTCLPRLPDSLLVLYLVHYVTNSLNDHNLPPCKPSKPFDETELSMGLLDSAPFLAALGLGGPTAWALRQVLRETVKSHDSLNTIKETLEKQSEQITKNYDSLKDVKEDLDHQLVTIKNNIKK